MYKELLSLTDRLALVTGGAGGIGRACASSLQEFGATVAILDLDADKVSLAVEDLSRPAQRVHGYTVDVADPEAVADVVTRVTSELGQLQIAVNAAGVASHGSSLDLPNSDWSRIMSVNLDGLFWCAREEARHMIAGGGGSIINIGSISGEIANLPQSQTAYNASKAGVHTLTKCLAVEFADSGVRVNAIAPAFIDTPLTREAVDPEWRRKWEELTPLGRLGTPEEVASMAAFLASDAASYMTGTVVSVDGGYLAR